MLRVLHQKKKALREKKALKKVQREKKRKEVMKKEVKNLPLLQLVWMAPKQWTKL